MLATTVDAAPTIFVAVLFPRVLGRTRRILISATGVLQVAGDSESKPLLDLATT